MIKGRFAPSPTGRMHIGNVFTALMSWLSVRSRGGKWVLRIEDLDRQRSKYEYARQIEDDLSWLGLDWDEGGLDDIGLSGPYSQSGRDSFYQAALERLMATGYTYPCRCTRHDIMASNAPHQSDGRIIYGGKCRPAILPQISIDMQVYDHAAIRLYVPDRDISFTDRVYGLQSYNLSRDCGDFVLRRADGAWAYQLAVVVDDALMGITEVVRGNDLLLSAAQQQYLYRLMGFDVPEFAHLPLLCNPSGVRLSKRDKGISMSEVRNSSTAEDIIGRLAYYGGIIPEAVPCKASELVDIFDWNNISSDMRIII